MPLNHEIGPHRRYIWARSELATFKRIKDSLGGTVNDVVLAVVTGSIREWLHSRGVRTEGLELRALVPVSIRAEDEHGNLGNRLTADARAAAGLHRGPGAPPAGDQRGDGGAEGIQTGAGRRNDLALQRLRSADAPRPGLRASTSPPASSTSWSPTCRGPQIPLYVLGRELEEVFPVAFLPQNHRLAVAIMSYHGKIGFGLLADYDSMEDIELLGAGINNALAELEAAASESAAAA